MRAIGLIGLIGLMVLAGCLAQNPPVRAPGWVGTMKNGCLPEAVVMTAGLREKGIPSHVLAMNFRKGGERWGHAVCVYQLQGQWWAWDSYWKSLKIAPAWPNAENEALAYLKARPDLRGAVMERAEVIGVGNLKAESGDLKPEGGKLKAES